MSAEAFLFLLFVRSKRAQRHIFLYVSSSHPPITLVPFAHTVSYFTLCLASCFIRLGVIGKHTSKFHIIIFPTTTITTIIALCEKVTIKTELYCVDVHI